MNSLALLPDDLLLLILVHLNIHDISNVAKTCRFMHQFTRKVEFIFDYILQNPFFFACRNSFREQEKIPKVFHLLFNKHSFKASTYYWRAWSFLKQQKAIFGEKYQFSQRDHSQILQWACFYPEVIGHILEQEPPESRNSEKKNHPLSDIWEFSIKSGCIDTVKWVINNERCVPFVCWSGSMIMASRYGHLEVVKLFLEDQRFDPSEHDNNPFILHSPRCYVVWYLIPSPISWACANGHLEVVKLLLEDKRVDLIVDHDNVAIIIASFNGHLKVVKLLLKDERVDECHGKGNALRCASGQGHLEVVKLLLEDEEIDPGNYNNDAIGFASANGHSEVVKLLLKDERVDPSDRNYIIIDASEYGHTEVIKLLLEDGRADPSYRANMAIRLASENGHLQVVKLLLEDGRADPSADNNYAIRWASTNGHLEVVKLLLEDGRADPSADNNYAIRWASTNGHLEVVKLLLEDGRADPSADNNYAIRWASTNGHLEVVKLLLEDGRVDPSINQSEPIKLAHQKGHFEIVNLLSQHPKCQLHQLNLS